MFATCKPVDTLPAHRYLCQRCGTERECKARAGQTKPDLCGDCKWVLQHEATDVQLPDEEDAA